MSSGNGAVAGAPATPPILFNALLTLNAVPGLAHAPRVAGVQVTHLRDIGVGEGRHEVFLGLDHQINAELVFKRIRKEALASRDAFFAEARRLYESRHRHVVPIAYACEDAAPVYLAMPHFARGSLQALLEQRCLSTREIVRLGLDFRMGLHHAHVRGVLHFDVKPTNVFLDDAGAATLADFGQSRLADPGGLADTPPMYPRHVPPEAYTGTQLTRRADVYQAGLTLYRMCVGAAAWDAQAGPFGKHLSPPLHDAVLQGRFPDRNAFPEHIPTRLRTLVTKALRPDPDKRWPTVLDLMNQLATVSGGDDLDWRPQVDGSGGMSWELTSQRATKRVALGRNSSGTDWRVEVTRLGLTPGAKPSRLKTECLGPASEAAARAHARKLLGVS